MNLRSVILLSFITFVDQAFGFNGDLGNLECPDDCHCYFFRVNWVTDCSDSNLTHIPYSEISPDVYILDLNNNLISEVEPFPQDFRVRSLELSENRLTHLKKESFAGLLYLIDACFSYNNISKVDIDVFDDSNGLIHLELQGNPFEEVEGPFLSISALLYLDLSHCNLTRLNEQFFSNLTHLTTLVLSNNPLQEIDSYVFKPLENLETLKMNHCNLTYIGDNVFRYFKILKNLELAENNFIRTNWNVVLNRIPLLESIDLRRSGLTKLPETTFYYNHYLRIMILAENDLADLDVQQLVIKLSHLESLDLSECKLNLPLSEDAFSNSTRIRHLYLSGNKLFSSDLLLALSPLKNLHKLSLSNCGLSQLPDTFGKFKSLRELDISHNPLKHAFVKLLAPLETLEYLNMGYSNLSYIHPSSFSKMTSLHRLVLSGNDLDSLEAGLFGNLTRLESLELNFCGLVRPLNATLFFNNLTYTDLSELQLAGNPLRVSKKGPLLPKQLSRLRTLDLSNCNLTFLPPDAFNWTRNITNLILSGNHFTSANTFKFLELLPKLETLDLRFNNLTTLSPKDFHLNPNVKKLKLIGNPWKCACSVANLWDWANIEKGDLDILEGATLTQGDVSLNRVKRKKLLVCHYDCGDQPVTIVMNRTVAGRRPFINPSRTVTVQNRTWAKYVRESGCEQTVTLHRIARSADVYDEDGVKLVYARHTPNTWASAAISAISIYAVLVAVLGIVILATRKRRAISRQAPMVEKQN